MGSIFKFSCWSWLPFVIHGPLSRVGADTRRKWSWLVEARTFKSQIDESVLCIISDVFVAVEIYTTAKYRKDYNANKIHPVIYGIFSFKSGFLYIISTVEEIFAAKKFAVVLFCGILFLRIAKKPAKIVTCDQAEF